MINNGGTWVSIAAGICILLMSPRSSSAQGDIVNVSGVQVVDVGFLVSGGDASGKSVNFGICGTASRIDVGDVRRGPGDNNFFAFTENRSPELVLVNWSGGIDMPSVNFRGSLKVPIAFWVVDGPFDMQKLSIGEAMMKSLGLWGAERMGVIFGNCEFHDATSHEEFLDLVDLSPTSGSWKDLRDFVGFRPDHVNVYWIRSVMGEHGSGVSNFGLQVVIGSAATSSLLTHEIGHSFSLTDIDGLADFNSENVMSQMSLNRSFFSEGQVFRSNFNKASIINGVLGLRAPTEVRDCDGAPSSCPALSERLWNDGSLVGECKR